MRNVRLIRIVRKPSSVQTQEFQDEESLRSQEYDFETWKNIVQNNLLPDAQQVFIHQIKRFELLCLCIGQFHQGEEYISHYNQGKRQGAEEREEEEEKRPMDIGKVVQRAEIEIDNVKYDCEMRDFDIFEDVFPPIYRSGGMKSKVAKTLANTIVKAKQWDEGNFNISSKTNLLFRNIGGKLKELNEKFQISEKTKKMVDGVGTGLKNFNEKTQLTSKISKTANKIDDKLKVTQKIEKVSVKINENVTFQKVKKDISTFTQRTSRNLLDIKSETSQRIQEKDKAAKQEREEKAKLDGESGDYVGDENGEVVGSGVPHPSAPMMSDDDGDEFVGRGGEPSIVYGSGDIPSFEGGQSQYKSENDNLLYSHGN